MHSAVCSLQFAVCRSWALAVALEELEREKGPLVGTNEPFSLQVIRS